VLSITNVDMRPRTLDFSSSSQGHVDVRAAVFGTILLANAIELLASRSGAVQLIVCEECGVTGCWMGGWACFRRMGPHIVQIPAFEKMEGDGVEEAGPPSYMTTHAVVRYANAAYGQLLASGTSLPPADELPRLTAREAVRILQWEAPLQVLGRFPHPPEPNFDAIIACSDGDVESERHNLRDLVGSFFARNSPVKCESADRLRSFFLDSPGYTEWCPVSVSRLGASMLHIADEVDLAL
jgi:hypothetical protein